MLKVLKACILFVLFCMSEWIFHALIEIKLIIKRMIVLEEVIMIVMKLKITVALKHREICMKQINPFQASVTFHIETSHCFAEQNKWLVSIWNATLGWAKMGAFKLIFPTFFFINVISVVVCLSFRFVIGTVSWNKCKYYNRWT